jgi:two-component system, LytTR family, sensor kinase
MNTNKLVPDRKRRFWLFQILGWILFGIIYLYTESQMTGPDALSGKYILTMFISLVTGFSVSLLLRIIYRIAYRKSRSIVVFAIVSLVCSLFGSLLWFSFMDLIELALDLGMPYSVWTQTHASGFTDYVTVNLLFLSSPLFAWSFIYFGYKLTEDLNREKEKYQRSLLQAKDAQLQMLRYQINPHFLFNSLNSVQALMYKNTTQADEMLTEFSEFLRYTLENKDELYVSLDQEIEMLSKYLYLEKIRFQEKLQYQIDIRDQTGNLRVLSFLLQPFVENAIKHGISKTAAPLKIQITSERMDRKLLITIRNSGKWKEPGKGNGIGIPNVRNRLENAYPGRYALSIAEKDHWVIVELKLPL